MSLSFSFALLSICYFDQKLLSILTLFLNNMSCFTIYKILFSLLHIYWLESIIQTLTSGKKHCSNNN